MVDGVGGRDDVALVRPLIQARKTGANSLLLGRYAKADSEEATVGCLFALPQDIYIS